MKPYTSVIIAALNEEAAIANVIKAVPRDLADEILLVDNGSSDRTAQVARTAGARVVHEVRRGYGRALGRRVSRSCCYSRTAAGGIIS